MAWVLHVHGVHVLVVPWADVVVEAWLVALVHHVQLGAIVLPWVFWHLALT